MPKLTAATKKKLNAAARLYWTFGPWDDLSSDTPFGIKEAETGALACAMVLGAAGEEFGLALYLGAEGFQTARRMNAGDMDTDEFAYCADVLSLYFGPPEDVPKSRRKEWGALSIIEEDGALILPTAMRKAPGAPARTPDEAEGRLLRAALEATVALIRAKKITDRKLRKAKTMPVFVVGLEGSLTEEAEPVVAPVTVMNPGKAVEISSDLRTALKSRTPEGRLMVGLVTAPFIVRDQQARVLVIVEPERGLILKAEPLLGPWVVEKACESLLDWLGGQRPGAAEARSPLPAELITDSLELYGRLKDLLPDFGMRVLCMEEVPQLVDVKKSLLGFATSPRPSRR